MAAGDPCATIIREIPPAWRYVKFTSGSVEPTPGDTLYGDTSNATAILELLVLSTGTWGGGDAAGWMFLSNWNGTAFTSGENWTKNTTTPANDGTFTGTPTTTAYATFDTSNDVPLLDFDDTSNEVILYLGKLGGNYASGGITVKLVTTGAAATNNYVFGGMWRSFTDDTDNILSTSFNAWSTPVYSSAIVSPSVIGELGYDTIAFTDGAQIDSLAAGEIFLLAIFRDAQVSGDTMAGDASVVDVEIVLT